MVNVSRGRPVRDRLPGFGVAEPHHDGPGRLRLRHQRRRSPQGLYRYGSGHPRETRRLTAGDTIVAFNGHKIAGWDQLTARIRANGDHLADIAYVRDGRTKTRSVNTSVLARASLDTPGKTVKVGFLGVSPTQDYQRQGPGFVATQLWDYTAATTSVIVHLPQRMVAVVKAAVGAPRGGQRAHGVRREPGRRRNGDRGQSDLVRAGAAHPEPAGRDQPVPGVVQFHSTAAAGRRTHCRRPV